MDILLLIETLMIAHQLLHSYQKECHIKNYCMHII
jgi:hypothetical protein